MKTFLIAPPEAKAPNLSLTEQEVHLIKALKKGDLAKEYQSMLFDLIVLKLCRLEGPSFAGEETHKAARNEGMRLVGIYLKHIANTPYDQL